MTDSKGYRGYVFSRPIDGQIIPQRVQNLVIRTYMHNNDLTFLLSATEYYMDDCYMILKGVLDDIDSLSGIIFYSMFMLPTDKGLRGKLFDAVLARGCSLHFALEDLVIFDDADTALIEDILMSRKLAAYVVITSLSKSCIELEL